MTPQQPPPPAWPYDPGDQLDDSVDIRRMEFVLRAPVALSTFAHRRSRQERRVVLLVRLPTCLSINPLSSLAAHFKGQQT